MTTYSEIRFLFHARNYDRSVQFYTKLLGMPILESWDGPDSKGTILAAGSDGCAFIEIFDGGHSPIISGDLGIALRVDSPQQIDEYFHRLSEEQARGGEWGFHLVETPAQKPWGQYAFTLSDPDGIHVTLYAVTRPG